MLDIKEKYENDGYVVLEGFFTEEEILEMRNEGDNLIKNMPPVSERQAFSSKDSNVQQNKSLYFIESSDKIRYFFEVNALNKDKELIVDPSISLNKIGHALHDLNPIFRKYTFDERVKETCFQLGFEDPAVVQSMYIFKNPGIGSEVTVHQDSTYLYNEPPKLVGFWIALDDATIENGCLWISNGSHKSGVHRRYIRNPDKNSDELLIYASPEPHYQKSNFTPVPVKKGTLVLIHGQVVHFSEPNKSKLPRHAYTFHVAETKNSKWSKDNWIQPSPEKPFLKLYKN